MPGIIVNKEKCRGCSLCVKACAAGAIKLVDKKAEVSSALCTGCSMCVSSCHFDALSVDAGASKAFSGDIAVFAERENGEFLPFVFELLGKGRELADAAGVKLCAIALGSGKKSTEEEAKLLAQYGADRFVICRDKLFNNKDELSFRDGLCEIIRAEKPDAVLFGATLFGRGTAPGVAAVLRTGLTADCTKLEIDTESGLLVQTRPAFGGNLMASIVCADCRPQMATVRPGVMKPVFCASRTECAITEFSSSADISVPALVLSGEVSDVKDSITDAKIIIDCGRGVGSKKNLKLVKELASKLGASVGCTRPLVDTGICEYASQIGQTGTTVSPDLLITLGISGAIQHLAGIGGAKKIIAVNTDPDAPIFSGADVKIVADCMEVVKEMLKSL